MEVAPTSSCVLQGGLLCGLVRDHLLDLKFGVLRSYRDSISSLVPTLASGDLIWLWSTYQVLHEADGKMKLGVEVI